jgi:AcrR family transcriptional regulator
MTMEQSKAGDTKNRILEAAEKLFTQQGVKTTSLADISRAAKISKGTLYYYYTTKEDIICDITDIHLGQMTRELMDWVSNIERETPRDEILMTVIDCIVSAKTRGKLHLYLLSESLGENNKLRTRMLMKYQEWQKVIQLGIKEANLQSKYSSEALSQIIVALIDGFSILKLMEIEQLAIEEAGQIIANGVKDYE